MHVHIAKINKELTGVLKAVNAIEFKISNIKFHVYISLYSYTSYLLMKHICSFM